MPIFQFVDETVLTFKRQLVERLTKGGLAPLFNLSEVQVAAVRVDQVHNIVIICERKLIAVQFLHAPGLELSKRDFLVSQLAIKFFVGELQELFQETYDLRILLIKEYLLNHRFGPLIHEHLIIFELFELSLVNTVHVLVYELMNDGLLSSLLYFHLLLNFVEEALIFLQGFDTAILQSLFSFFAFLFHLVLQNLQYVSLRLYFLSQVGMFCGFIWVDVYLLRLFEFSFLSFLTHLLDIIMDREAGFSEFDLISLSVLTCEPSQVSLDFILVLDHVPFQSLHSRRQLINS